MIGRPLLPAGIAACLLDLYGVLTRTAELHAEAEKHAFDAFLRGRTVPGGGAARPFELVGGYDRYVDGEPRAEGVRSFLASRGIELPECGPDDPPAAETVHAVDRSGQARALRAGLADLIGAP